MAERTLNTKLCIRSDNGENWKAANPILLNGELGLEEDTRRVKIGDGKTPWVDLNYFFTIGISKQELIDYIYPINFVVVTVGDTNPGEILGGVWRETKVIAITEMRYWVRVE